MTRCSETSAGATATRPTPQFGTKITPNEHALANQYMLFDNFYDAGELSADGHNWLMQGNANDYNEWDSSEWARSYPAEGADALAYQRDWFLWNAAERAHQERG